MGDKTQHPPTIDLSGVRLRPLRMAVELYLEPPPGQLPEHERAEVVEQEMRDAIALHLSHKPWCRTTGS